MNKFFRNCKPYGFFLILLLGLTPLLWYKPGFLAFGHDMGFPLDPIGHFRDRLFVWTERLNLGLDQSISVGAFFIHGFEALIKWLGFSIQATQKISFVFWFVTPGLAMYYFIRSLGFQKKLPFLPLIASIFYMFNHFFLQAWFIAERTKFSLIVALPLILSFLIRGLQQKMSLLKSAVLINLILFFFNGGGGQGLSLYGGLFISLGICLIYFGRLKRNILLTALILFLFVILNFYWILPFSHSALVNYSQSLASSGGIEGILNWTRTISKQTSFLNLFRLQGVPDWYDNPNHPYANLFLESPFLIIVSFLWSLLAFASILLAKNQKEKKYVLFFVLLALISMVFTAGTHPPTGKLYEAFMRYIPFFSIFRTPFYKFGYGIWFGYAFLISFAVSKLLMKFKKKRVYSSLSFIFIIFILLYNFPFFTGSFFNWNPPLSTMVKVPNYIFEFGEWIDSLGKKDGRVLMLPPFNKNWLADTYDWGYWSLDTAPSLLTRKSVIANSSRNQTQEELTETLYLALLERNEHLARRLISILNIKYFLLRKDVLFDLDWCPTTSPDEWQDRIGELNWVKLEHEFGEWIVYGLEMNESLPHFYTPKKFVYIQGSADDLVDMVSFGDWGVRPEIYFAENADNSEKADSIFVAGQCSRCNPLEETVVELPLIRFLPDSIFYPLIRWKEARWEKKVRDFNDPIQAIDLNLGLASKRLVEIEGLMYEEKNGEIKKEVLIETMKKYQARIEDISYLLTQIKQESGDINEAFLRIRDHFRKYKEVLNRFREGGLDKEMRIRFENAVWELNDFLIRLKSKHWASEEGIKRYNFDIPKKAEYELFVKNESIGDYFIQDPLKPIVYELNGKPASKSGELQDNGWILVDKIEVEKGRHRLAIVLPEAKNLVEKEDFLLEPEGGEKKKASFPVNNFDYAEVYKISFVYKPSIGKQARFIVSQDTDAENKELGRFEHKIDTDLYRDTLPGTFQIFFKPDPGAKQAALEFIFEANERGESFLKVEKIRVERVWNPKAILRMVNNDIRKDWMIRETPKITFRKINPTKYEVEVEGAKKPYTLIFSESFHKGWKARIMDSTDGEINSRNYEEIVASYFDGEIKEGVQGDDFWPKLTFKNWSGKSISEDRHVLANSYANSWHITPEVSGGKEDYKLIIEFWPQRLFYLGIGVSILSLLVCLGYLSWFSFKEKKL